LILIAVALNYRDRAVAIGVIPRLEKSMAADNRSADIATADIAPSNVTVTERAAQRIGEILRLEPAGTMLRVSVEGGGCSGFQYKFDTERAKADDDTVIERNGATVLIDPISLNYMAGSQIDFVDDLIGSAFKVHNPKATASCGCGTSFAL
jgi:iron-sulfur cluster assembly accessory protein